MNNSSLLTPSTSVPSERPRTSQRGATGESQSRNPVAARLYKVLNTKFNDDETGIALQTLSELYATPPPGKASQNARSLLEDVEEHIPGQDSSVSPASSMNLVEGVPGESAARARKNMRKDMETKLADGSRQFLAALGEVDFKLRELQAHLAAMRTSCDAAETQLTMTNESSKLLLERAGNLRDERQEVEEKKTIITLFLKRFTLSDAEVEAITSRDISMGPGFFEAMDRTERIREDCRVLMAGEDGSTKAGLEIMTSTSSYLEQGYEKILRYCSNQFRQVGRDSQIEVNAVMREAVQRLRKRPELLTEALNILSEARQATLLSAFVTALTRGGPSGFPRPIELHAHDPLRYLGDILAWVHQTIAAEHEFVDNLFGIKSDKRMMGSVRKLDNEEDWMKELMDLSVSKFCVPLRVRVQQTIRSQESSIVSYKIANLLQFYLLTMYRTIGEQALLSTTLKELTDLSYKIFYESIETHSQSLSRITLDEDDPSLTPPLFILDHAQVLREVMSVYQSSLLGDENEDDILAGFDQVLDIMVDPVVTLCFASAEIKQKNKPKWDGPIFILNYLCYLTNVLSSFEFTLKKQKQIQSIIDERIRLLVDEHTSNVIQDAGLFQVVETIRNRTTEEPLSRIPATQPLYLQRALRQFSLWLSGLEVVHSPRLSQLIVQKLHSQIHQEALARLATAYRMICAEVKKPENKYEAGATLLGSERPFGQVHLLGKIFGLEEEQKERIHSTNTDDDSGHEEEDEDDGENEDEEDGEEDEASDGEEEEEERP